VLALLATQPRDEGLHGTGVGAVPYRGRVRKALSPEEAISTLEPGEVLVVPFTTPAYNVVLPLAGGIVTVGGGPLCHAAVLARELGIAAVVGASGAVDQLADGMLVEVDPVAGEVRILERQPVVPA
jgi:pyruvate,water dikinase